MRKRSTGKQCQVAVRFPVLLSAIVALTLPSQAFAQTTTLAQRPTALVYVPFSRSLPAAAGTARDSLVTPIPRDAVGDRRDKRILRGALIGASIGLGIGVYAGSHINTGCDAVAPSTCSSARKHRNMILSLGAAGTITGGVIGMVIGAVLPGHAPRK